MRAILVATGESPELAAFREHWPTPLLPLADRPWIQHVVEWLASRGITEFDVILSHLPGPVRALLGDGGRWGVTIRCHLARDSARPFRAIRALGFPEADGPVLLAWADRLAAVDPADHRPSGGDGPVLYHFRGRALGWGWVSANSLAGVPLDADEPTALRLLGGTPGASAVEVRRRLDSRTLEGLLDAQSEVLSGKFPGLLLNARQVEPGVWLSRNVSLHPEAEIVAPVCIGEDCQIGPGVHLGPGAVIGRGCVLDAGCSVRGSVVFPSSYIGRGLELADVLVDRNRLIHPLHGAALTVEDDFLLANLAEQPLRRIAADLLARGTAAAVLVAAAPLLAMIAVARKLTRPGPLLNDREVVRLPAPLERTRWRTYRLRSFAGAPASGLGDLLLRVLPGLVHVVRGQLRLVGLPPRPPSEVRRLPRDWRALYLKAHAGLITEAMTTLGPSPTPEEVYTAAAGYAAAASLRHDAALVFRYLRRVILGGPLPAGAVRPAPEVFPSWPPEQGSGSAETPIPNRSQVSRRADEIPSRRDHARGA